MNLELTYSEVITKIEELSNFENLNDSNQMQSNLEEINSLVKILQTYNTTDNVIVLSNLEYNIVSACIEVVDDLPCGFEAIDGYVDLDDETWEAIDSVKSKI
jgi:hypothetical protein